MGMWQGAVSLAHPGARRRGDRGAPVPGVAASPAALCTPPRRARRLDRYTYDALLPITGSWRSPKRPYSGAGPPGSAVDLVLIMDLPGEVAFARKGEFTPEELKPSGRDSRSGAPARRGGRRRLRPGRGGATTSSPGS
jgi:hypothetical protein